MSAITSFVTDVVGYYLNTASKKLVRAHASQFDLTGDDIDALYWPPEEREAARVITRRVVESADTRHITSGNAGRVRVRAYNARELVPEGFYARTANPESEPILVLRNTIFRRWTSLIPGTPNGRCINDAPWIETCEAASAHAADNIERWASGLVADLICYGEAKEAINQVFSSARSLQDARNWIPQLPMILNYSAGKYVYGARLHADITPGGFRVDPDTVAKTLEKIKNFKEVKNGWVPSPGQRARLKALQGWINKASFLMADTESGNTEPLNIAFVDATVTGAPIAASLTTVEE